MAGSARIWVFDVEHGSCACLVAPNDNTLLIDCGRGEFFSPVVYLCNAEGVVSLTKLVVTHPHDDHIQDIDRIIQRLPPRVLSRQKEYDWQRVEGESPGDFTNLRSYAAFQARYTSSAEPISWGDVNVSHWCLSVKEAKSMNEAKYINNSSIVTVITRSTFKMVLPGDLEVEGWRQMLRRQAFVEAIANPTIFVASHHGHSSGYLPEIFDAMGRPEFNLISCHRRDEHVDEAYSTDRTAEGTWYNGRFRHSFTTRTDGSFVIDVDENGRGTFQLVRLAPNI